MSIIDITDSPKSIEIDISNDSNDMSIIDITNSPIEAKKTALNKRAWNADDFIVSIEKDDVDFLIRANEKFNNDEEFYDDSSTISELSFSEELDAGMQQFDDLILADPPKSLNCILFDHQLYGLAWLYDHELRNKGGLLADDQGLGKTVQMIALMLKNTPKRYFKRMRKKVGFAEDMETGLNSSKTLIIVPLVTINQWENEINRFTNYSLIPLIFHGKSKVKTFDDGVDVVITTYHTASNEIMKTQNTSTYKSPISEENWFRIILDESHTVKNSKTQLFTTISTLSSIFRWCLTGTPIFNNLMELYAQLSICRLENLLDEDSFRQNVHRPMQKMSKEIANIKNASLKRRKVKQITHSETFQVLREIVREHVLRRSKQARTVFGKPIIPLPQKKIYYRQVYFSPREAEQYKALQSGAQGRLEVVMSLIKRKIDIPNSGVVHFLLALMRLRQFCDHPLIVAAALATEEDFLDGLIHSIGTDSISHLENVKEFLPTNLYLAIKSRLKQDKIAFAARTAEHKTRVADDADEYENIKLSLPQAVLTNLKEIFPAHPIIKELNNKQPLELKDIPFWCSSKMVALIDDLFQVKLYHAKPIRKEFHKKYNSWQTNRPDKNTSKLENLVNLSYDYANMKVLIFTQFVTFMDILETTLQQLGFRTVRLDGSMNQDIRQANITSFAENPNVEVFLISLKAGGVGLNLVTASHIFLMDMWWNGCLEDQAVDRVHRITQQKDVKVIRYCIEDSVEMKMLALQDEKRAISKGTFSEQFEEAKVLNWKEIAKLIGAKYGKQSKKQKRNLEKDLESWNQVKIDVTNQIIDCYNGDIKRASEASLGSLRINLPDNSFPEKGSDQEVKNYTSNVSLAKDPLALNKCIKSYYMQNKLCSDINLSSNLTSITVSGTVSFPNQSLLKEHLNNANHLIRLTIENVYGLQSNFFVDILPTLTALREISIGKNGASVNDDVVAALCIHFGETLLSLSLRCCYAITNLDQIFKNFICLENLDISNCSEASLDASPLITLSWGFKLSLKYLNLSNCISLGRNSNIEAHSILSKIFQQIPNLLQVDISGIGKSLINLNTLKALSNLSYVRKINLSECPSVLKHFEFLESVTLKCTQLNSLNISNLLRKKGDAEHISKLSPLLKPLSEFSYMSSLNLASNVSVTDSVLEDICKSCMLLSKLNVSKCVSISTLGFIQSLPSLSRINTLWLSWCKNVDDEVIEKVYLNSGIDFISFERLFIFGCEVSFRLAKTLKSEFEVKTKAGFQIYM